MCFAYPIANLVFTCKSVGLWFTLIYLLYIKVQLVYAITTVIQIIEVSSPYKLSAPLKAMAPALPEGQCKQCSPQG